MTKRLLIVGTLLVALMTFLADIEMPHEITDGTIMTTHTSPTKDGERSTLVIGILEAHAAAKPHIDPSPRFLRTLVMGLIGGGTPPLDGADLHKKIDRALKPTNIVAERVEAVEWLARFSSDEAVRALERLLQGDSPSVLKVAVAEGLGASNHPEAQEILESLLDSADDELSSVALRELSMRGDSQAAASLANVPDLSSAAVLEEAFWNTADDNSAISILEALGERNFTETEDFFRSVVDDSEYSLEVRTAALGALANSTADAADYLFEVATMADVPEIRVAAIKAVGWLVDSVGNRSIKPLVALLEVEENTVIRSELYDTFTFHTKIARRDIDTQYLITLVFAETDPDAKVRAYRFVGSLLRLSNDTQLVEPFDQIMVPWLELEAERRGNPYTRHLSFDALKLAGTPGAERALRNLTNSPNETVSKQAKKALQMFTRVAHERTFGSDHK